MGFWGGLGGILKKAAPIAASFIPGIGPIAGPALGMAMDRIGGGNKGLSPSSYFIKGNIGSAGNIFGGQPNLGTRAGMSPYAMNLGGGNQAQVMPNRAISHMRGLGPTIRVK